VADAFCQRILTLCLEEAGEPPCRFAFIQTGSAGRMEQTLSTDQDNAIIFENLKGEELQSAYAYFTLIGKRVNEMLSFTGYQLCPGQNMAGNPAWCQPLDSWKKYFSDWIVMPGPEELLEVSIFFDFRFCFGDSSLTDELREFVKSDLAANDIFFHHMAAAWKPFNPSAANLSQGKTDIKRILMPLTGLIRLYALKYSLNGYSTLERSVELYSGGKLDHQLLREIIRAWKDLSSLRLSHQASCINKGIEPDNIIDFRGIGNDLLSYAEQAIATVNNLMLKTGNDFYTESL
jgi:CBS domain-containing protein